MNKKSLIITLLLSISLLIVNAQKTDKNKHRKTDKKIDNNKHKRHNQRHNRKSNNHKANTNHQRSAKARRTAHVSYRGLPARGALVTTVNVGFIDVKFGGVNYRYNQGIYYKPRASKFVVARAPLGLRIRTLPVGHRKMIVGNRPYFYYYGTYYQQPENSTDEYEVINAPLGAEVDALPEGYQVITVDNQEFYKLDEIYYEPRINDKDEEYYVVVESPIK